MKPPNILIPSEVLFNPYLTPIEKLLFGIIKNITNLKGKCWGTNEYMATLLNTNRQTISNGITVLKNLQYIKIEYKKGNKREIIINEKYPEIYEKPIKEFIGTTYNLNYRLSRPGLLFKLYTSIKQIIDLYNLNYIHSENFSSILLARQRKADSFNITKSINKSINKKGSKRFVSKTLENTAKNSPIQDIFPKQEKEQKQENDILDKNKKELILEQRKKRAKNLLNKNPLIKELINYWNSKKELRHLTDFEKCININTVTMNTILNIHRFLNGTLFPRNSLLAENNRKFTSEDFMDSVDNFSLAFHPPYLPKDKTDYKTISLADFLYCEYRPVNKSLFLKYLGNKPELCIESKVKQSNPELTKQLIRLFEHYYRGNEYWDWGSRDINRFVAAANRLDEFWTKYHLKEKIKDEYNLANYYLRSLVKAKERDMIKNPVSPVSLSCDYFIDTIFPGFLNECEILKK